MSELFAIINGIKICYKIKGDGYPVILIHGFAKKEFWVCQIDELSKTFKVIWYDNRGVGKSDRPNEPYTMELLADDLKGLMDFLGINKAHMIGHSLGGMVLQHFALKYPKHLNKLVLISTNAGTPDKAAIEMFKNNQIALYETRLNDPEKAFYNKMKGRVTRKFLKMMQEDPKRKFHGSFSAEDLMLNDNIEPWRPQDIINHANALANHHILNRLHDIKNETLILTADKDRITPKIESEQMHEKMPKSKLKVFSGGHYFPLEVAPEVNQVILEFLKG